MNRTRKKTAVNPAHAGGDALEYFRRREAEDPEFAALAEDERDMRALAYRVREMREAAGLSQAEVAERIGTKQPSIARIERGLTRPTIEMLQRLARVFEMRVQIAFVPAPRKRRRKARAASERPAAAAGEARPAAR